jgi:hypothetical protein
MLSKCITSDCSPFFPLLNHIFGPQIIAQISSSFLKNVMYQIGPCVFLKMKALGKTENIKTKQNKKEVVLFFYFLFFLGFVFDFQSPLELILSFQLL